LRCQTGALGVPRRALMRSVAADLKPTMNNASERDGL
jgi:hypothetical protein